MAGGVGVWGIREQASEDQCLLDEYRLQQRRGDAFADRPHCRQYTLQADC